MWLALILVGLACYAYGYWWGRTLLRHQIYAWIDETREALAEAADAIAAARAELDADE